MKRFLILLLTIIGSSLFSVDSFKTVLGSGNTVENHSVEAVMDGDSATSVLFNPGEKSAWIKLTLEKDFLIEKMNLEGVIPYGVTAYLDYEVNGYIQSFPSSYTTGIINKGIIDVSEDRVVTDQIYLRLFGDNLDNVELKEISVTTKDYDKSLSKKELIVVSDGSSSSRYTGAQHLLDGLIGTVWRTWNNELWKNSHWFVLEEIQRYYPYKISNAKWNRGVAELKPVDSESFKYIELYVDEDATGELLVSVTSEKHNGLVGTYILDDLKGSWIKIDVSSYGVLNGIRLDVASAEKTFGGLGEIELWGDDNPPRNEFLELIPYFANDNISDTIFTIDELYYDQTYQLDVITTGNIEAKLNNNRIKEFNVTSKGGYRRYRYLLSDRELTLGENFLLFDSSNSFEVLNAQISLVNNESNKVDLPYSSITNGQLYTGLEGKDFTLDFTQGIASVDRIRVYYNEDKPNGLYLGINEDIKFPRIISDNESFIEYEVDGNYSFIGINNPKGTTEVIIYGKDIEVKKPFVKILFPAHNESYEVQIPSYKPIWGITDSPESLITIDGEVASVYGNYFWLESTKGKNKSKKTGKYTAVAELTTSDNRVFRDTIDYILQSNSHEFTLDQEDIIYYTTEDSFTFTGRSNPWNSDLYIDNIFVEQNNNMNFTYNYPLKDGLNVAVIELRNTDGSTKELHYRKIYKSINNLTLKVTSPTNGTFVNKDFIDITGFATSNNLDRVTVNNKEAVLRNGQFKAFSIPLELEENIITVNSYYSTGESLSESITIFKDLTPPEIKDVLPEDNSWFATPYVEVSGTVIEDNGVAVFVNKIKATISGDTFTVSIPVTEVENDVLIEARDSSGNLYAYPVFNINTDLTKPEEFTVTSNYNDWTNDRRPILYFNTTDSYAGMSHYEISINGGKLIEKESGVQTPFLEDGIIPVVVRAYDKVGNYRDSIIDLKIDTLPPDEPTDFRIIPGNASVTLMWNDNDDETRSYVISNDNGELKRVLRGELLKQNEGSDYYEITFNDLENGEILDYKIEAIDRAGNISTPAHSTVTVGIIKEDYNEDGTLVEYKDVKLLVAKESLPENIKEIVVTEIESEEMEEYSTFPIISPIKSFSVITKDGEHKSHVKFEKNFTGLFTYDETAIPEGFPEEDLDVYYFDTNWSKWFKVENSAVDTENNTVYFATNHFTEFSVQPTVLDDVSPQELADVEYSPFNSKIAHAPAIVSPQTGNLTTSMTEFSLPGKNGFDLDIRRVYDSATAKSDAAGLNMNVSVSVSDIVSGDVTGLIKQIGTTPHRLITDAVDKYLLNNGDYAYSMGQGWRLNLPYIKSNNESVLVRTPSGSFHSISSMIIRPKDYEAENGIDRDITFENHEGDDFIFKLKQQRSYISASSLVGVASGNIMDLIPTWRLVSAELILKDGTIYTFDSTGKVKSIKDPTGLNEITIAYKTDGKVSYFPNMDPFQKDGFNNIIDYITDSMGRKIVFEYYTDFEYLSLPQIKKIYIENDPQGREVTYKYENPNKINDIVSLPTTLPILTESTDVNNRKWEYDYGLEFLFAGSIGEKINALALVLDICTYGQAEQISGKLGLSVVTLHGSANMMWTFPMTNLKGFGIGETDIEYKKETLEYFNAKGADYLFGMAPTAIDLTVGLDQRAVVEKLSVKLDGVEVKKEEYSYDFEHMKDGQFYSKKTTVDDGRKIDTYENFYTMRLRLNEFDWSDLVENVLTQGFVWNPILSFDYIPLVGSVTTKDKATGNIIKKNKKSYDLMFSRVLTDYTYTPTGYYSGVTYGYDWWGNIIKTEEETALPERTRKKETNYLYHNTNIKLLDGFDDGINFLSGIFDEYLNINLSFYDNTDLDIWDFGNFSYAPESDLTERYNILKAKVVTNYDEHNDRETVSKEYYHYDTKGQLSKKHLITESGLSTTSYGYGYDASLGLTGELTSTTTPSGQVITKDYDYTDPNIYSITDKFLNIKTNDPLAPEHIETRKVFDKTMGYLVFTTDGRGYTTSFTYDKIGRKTSITYPDEDSDPSNNPRTLIDYDDTNLIVTETKKTGAITKYYFDNLSRLLSIKKDNETNVTSFTYNSCNDIEKFTNPNGHTTEFTYDGIGQITSEKYTENNGEEDNELIKTISYSYSDLSKFITFENGTFKQEYYDFNRNLIKTKYFGEFGDVVAEDNNYYDGAGNLVKSVDREGNETVYEYNGRNLLIKTILPEADFYLNNAEITGQSYSLASYDLSGNKISETVGINGNDQKVKGYSYDGLGRLLKESLFYIDNSGETKESVTSFKYDDNNNLLETTDPKNNTWKKEYTVTNQVKTETDPLLNKTTYTYDIGDRLVSMTDPRGHKEAYKDLDFTIKYSYNLLDRLTSADLPARYNSAEDKLDSKPVISFTYDKAGNVLSRTEPDGGVTTYTYSQRKRVLTETKSGKNGNEEDKSYTTKSFYDGVGNLIRKTLPDNTTSTYYTYDTRNRLTKETYADSTYKEYGYNDNDNLIWEIDENGFTTLYDYDSLGRIKIVTDKAYKTIQNKYDLFGNASYVEDRNGNIFKREFNSRGSLLKEINGRGKEKSYFYDLNGNLVKDIDANGTTADYTILSNNLLSSITYTSSDNNSTQEVGYIYDEAGALKSVTDKGITTKYNYIDGTYTPDPFDQVKAVETVGYSSGSYEYDYLNRLTKSTYNSGLVVENNYNNLSQLESITNFASSREFNTNGLLSAVTFTNGVKNSYTYTDKLQLDTVDYSLNLVSLKNYDYEYDLIGNIVEEKTNSTQNYYGYSARGELSTALLIGGAAEEEFDLEKEGNTIYSGDVVNDVIGDKRFKLHDVVLTDEELSIDWGAKSFTIDTDYAFRIKRIILHRELNSPTRVTKDTLAIYTSNFNQDRAYKKVDLFDFKIDEVTGDIEISFESAIFARFLKIHSHFNAMDADGNQLFKDSDLKLSKDNPLTVYAVTGGRNEFYNYDPNSNRAKRMIMAKSVAADEYTYYEGSDLLKTDAKFGYKYDDNGNLLVKGSVYTEGTNDLTFTREGEYFEYKYDLKNRLTEVHKLIGDTLTRMATYTYDSNNYRIKKENRHNEITTYVFDLNGNVIEENTATTQTSFVFMNNRHIAKVVDDKKFFYATNHVGSTILLTDEDGEIVWSGDITPFGDKEDSTGLEGETVKYTGKTLDPDTGLYYFNARWYDPNLGRFITEDPIKHGNNWFVYARNNPIRFIDPTGLNEIPSNYNFSSNDTSVFSSYIDEYYENLNPTPDTEGSTDTNEIPQQEEILEAAREFEDIDPSYDLGSKYDTDEEEFYKWIDSDNNGSLDTKEILEDPQIDCSGFTKAVYDMVGIDIPHGASNQRDAMEQTDNAMVGGLMFIPAPAGTTIPHIVIISGADENGNASTIIESSSAADGYIEHDVPQSYLDSDFRYLRP